MRCRVIVGRSAGAAEGLADCSCDPRPETAGGAGSLCGGFATFAGLAFADCLRSQRRFERCAAHAERTEWVPGAPFS